MVRPSYDPSVSSYLSQLAWWLESFARNSTDAVGARPTCNLLAGASATPTKLAKAPLAVGAHHAKTPLAVEARHVKTPPVIGAHPMPPPESGKTLWRRQSSPRHRGAVGARPTCSPLADASAIPTRLAKTLLDVELTSAQPVGRCDNSLSPPCPGTRSTTPWSSPIPARGTTPPPPELAYMQPIGRCILHTDGARGRRRLLEAWSLMARTSPRLAGVSPRKIAVATGGASSSSALGVQVQDSSADMHSVQLGALVRQTQRTGAARRWTYRANDGVHGEQEDTSL